MTIFVINPGSSSLKVALFKNAEKVFTVTKRHDSKQLAEFKRVVDQLEYRLAVIDEIIEEQQVDFSKVDAIAARGGFCKQVEGGTYQITETLLDDLRAARYGEHAANLSPMCADILSKRYGIPAFFTDPVSVDEFMPEAYITGVPGIRRFSQFHALNQRVAARRASEQLGKTYESANLIVAHMGGGVTIGAHHNGRVIDAVNPSNEGPMCIDRPGSLPNLMLVDYIFENNLNREEARRKLSVASGFIAYFGMTDLIEIEEKALENPEIALLLDAMCYRIAYYICALSAAFDGPTDAIVLTGGMARSDWVVPKVTSRAKHIAPILLMPGESELEALAAGTERVLSGVEKAKIY